MDNYKPTRTIDEIWGIAIGRDPSFCDEPHREIMFLIADLAAHLKELKSQVEEFLQDKAIVQRFMEEAGILPPADGSDPDARADLLRDVAAFLANLECNAPREERTKAAALLARGRELRLFGEEVK